MNQTNETSRDIPGVIAPPPLIYLAGLALGLIVRRRWPHPLVPDSLRPLRWALGAGLMLGGLVLIGWAVRTMYLAGTHPEPNKPVTALVTEGPFRLSRNPIYLGFTVAYLGLALLLDALWSLLLLPAVLAVMVRGVIAREEAYLERRFDERYRAYRARVRRWI